MTATPGTAPGTAPGYAALFGADPLAALESLAVEATVVSTPDDLLPAARDRLVSAADRPLRFAATDDIGAYLVDQLVPATSSAPAPAAPTPLPGKLWKTYASTGAGALLVRRRSDGDGRPLVLFHSSPGSGKKLEPLLAALAPGRPLYAFDTLGNGDSDKPELLRPPGLDDYAVVVEQALDDLGLEEVDLYGTHTGALVALEVALRLGSRARSVIFEGITLFDPEENAAFLAHHFIDLSPRFDGSHLIVAWGHVRDAHLWFPWFERRPDRLAPFPHPTAEMLHAYLLELLRSGPSYQGPYRAVFEHRTAERLALLRTRVLLCHAPTDPLGRFSERAAELAGAETLLLPSADPADAAPLFARFLDSDGA
jgi:pimeloyl-ACP methyl ester carboxylesterase